MINSGRGRPRKIPAEQKIMVQIGLSIDGVTAAAIDTKIKTKEYKNRSDFMRQAIDGQLNSTKITATTKLSPFELLAQFAEEWRAIIADCHETNNCLDCPVTAECSKADVELSRIVDFVKKVKTLESKDDLSRLLKGFEMLQED